MPRSTRWSKGKQRRVVAGVVVLASLLYLILACGLLFLGNEARKIKPKASSIQQGSAGRAQ